MPSRRATPRFHLVLVLAVVSIDLIVSSQSVVGQKGGVARVTAPASPQVPTLAVPSIAVPRVPAQNGPPAPPQAAKYLEPQRLEALAQAARMGVNYMPGEVIVKFKADVAKADEDRALSVMASQPTSDSIEQHSGFAIVRDASQPNAYILAEQLRAQPEVEYAEPNFFLTVDPFERGSAVLSQPLTTPPSQARRAVAGSTVRVNGTPTDTFYGAYQWNFPLIGMPAAWELQPGGNPDLIVAVIDTGITTAPATLVYPVWTGSSFQTLTMPTAVNPDLPASRLTLAKDFIGARFSPPAPIADLEGHGTHVSGTIAEETNNGLLASGMAYRVKIMPVKVCQQYWDLMIARGVAGTPGFDSRVDGTCLFSDVADGIVYAVDHGARVLNLSLGSSTPATVLQSALQYAASKDVFVAVAMGNDYAKGDPVQYPAAYAQSIAGVMSVAAVGPNSTHASYSSSGSYCEIAAPGGNSDGSRLDSGAVWQSTLIPGNVTSSILVPRFDGYNLVGYYGTSMAAPHVAALAALILSQQPSLTGAQVEQIIRASALDLGDPKLYGAGLIQARKALFGQSVHSK